MFLDREFIDNGAANSNDYQQDDSQPILQSGRSPQIVLEEHPEIESMQENFVDGIPIDGGYEFVTPYNCTVFSDTTRSKRKYSMKNRPHAATFRCTFCDITIKYPSKIIEHLRIHSGERPFKCNTCGASFTQSGALTAHIRSHSGDRPFSCHYCSRQFTTSGQRSVHEKICNAHLADNNDVDATGSTTCEDDVCKFVKRDSRRRVYTNYYEGTDDFYIEEDYVEEDDPDFTKSSDYKTEDLQQYSFCENYSTDEIVKIDGNETSQFTNCGNDYFENCGRVQAIVDSSMHITDQNLFVKNDFVDNSHPKTELVYFKAEDDSVWNSNEKAEDDELHKEIDTTFTKSIETTDLLDSDCYVNQSIDNGQMIVENVEYEYVFEDSQMSQDINADIGMEYVEASASPPSKGRKRRNSATQEKVLVTSDLLRFATPLAMNRRRNVRKLSAKYQNNTCNDGGADAAHISSRGTSNSPNCSSSTLDCEISVKVHAEKSMKRQATVHTCEYCGRHLKYPSKIEAHMRTHTNEKPFKCTICGLAFAQNTTLRMHLRRHLNHKPFVCPYINCGHSFINGGLLNAHIQKRHDQTTINTAETIAYQCGKCNNVFKSVRTFKKHEKCCVDVLANEPDYDIIWQDNYR